MDINLKKELQKYLPLSDVSMIYNYSILLGSLNRKDIFETDIQYILRFKLKEFKPDLYQSDSFNSINKTTNERYNRDAIQPIISKWNNLINESKSRQR